MTGEEKILHYLGLAVVSQNAALGVDKTLSALKRHRLRLAVFSSDGERTAQKARRSCEEAGVPVLCGPFDKLALGGAVGGGSVTVVGVKDKGLADAILRVTEERTC